LLEGFIKIGGIKDFWDTLYSSDPGSTLTLCAWHIAAVAHIDRRQYFTAYCCHLHTQPRAHDRMQRRRRDARAFIYPLFICQRARYRRSPRPCRGQIWKVINRPVLERSASLALLLPFLLPRDGSFSRELLANQTTAHWPRRCERAPFSIGTRGFLSRRCESMDGDRSQKVEPILLWNRDLDWDTRICPGRCHSLRVVKLSRIQIIR